MQGTMMRMQPVASQRFTTRLSQRAPVALGSVSRGALAVRATFEQPNRAKDAARQVSKIDQGSTFVDASGQTVKQAFGGTPSATRDYGGVGSDVFRDASGELATQIGGEPTPGRSPFDNVNSGNVASNTFTDATGQRAPQIGGSTPVVNTGKVVGNKGDTFTDATGQRASQVGSSTPIIVTPPITPGAPAAKPTPTPVTARVSGSGGSGGASGASGGSGGSGGGGGGGAGKGGSGGSVPAGGADGSGIWSTLKTLLGVGAILFALSVIYKKLQKPEAQAQLEKAHDKVSAKAHAAAAKGQSKASSVKHAASDAAHSAASAVRHGVDEVKEKASDVKHSASDAKHAAGAKVSEVLHKGDHKVERAKEHAHEGASHAGAAAQTEGRGILDGLKDAASSVAHKVQGGAETAEAKAKSTVDAVKGALNDKDTRAPLFGVIGATLGAGLLTAAYFYDKRNGGDTFGKATGKAKKAARDLKSQAKAAANNLTSGSGNTPAPTATKTTTTTTTASNASKDGHPSYGPGYQVSGGPNIPKGL